MLANSTAADLLRPSERWRALAYELLLVLGGSLAIAVSARIAVGRHVPITGQTLAVLMIAALFGSHRGVACLLAYLAEGAAGLPVFAQGKFGLVTFAGPTGGYLIGFLPAVFVVGLLAERGWDRRFCSTVLAMVIGNIIIYAFGLTWLSILTGPRAAIGGGLYLFIPGDILKIFLAAAMLPSAWKILRRLKPTR